MVPDDSETASCVDEEVVSFCSSARHILVWWNEREREGIEDWKLAMRGAARIWRGAEIARAAARRKMYLSYNVRIWFSGNVMIAMMRWNLHGGGKGLGMEECAAMKLQSPINDREAYLLAMEMD